MKSLFRWLFSTKSNSKKIKYEIILICYLILISIIIIVISNTINLDNVVDRVLGIVILLQWLIFFIPCVLRIIDISDYNEKIKVVSGKKHFKFEPVLCSVSEIEKWIINAVTPDTLYVKGSDINKVTIISVTYETRGKNGPFINKQIWINDKEIENVHNIKDEIYHLCKIKDDCVYLLAITEYNDPKDFNKLINK